MSPTPPGSRLPISPEAGVVIADDPHDHWSERHITVTHGPRTERFPLFWLDAEDNHVKPCDREHVLAAIVTWAAGGHR